MPGITTKRHIFKIHTSRMNLAEDVDLEEYVMTKNDVRQYRLSLSESLLTNEITHTS